MQFSESWLRTYCNPPLSSAELAEILTMSGMEVEEAHPAAPAFTGVVVGRILYAEQHPNADRLRVCMVDAGAHSPDGPLQIVCGAPNARAGLLAPLALVGASLPPGDDGKPFVISKGKLRGVESFGMLCAGDELGLSSDHSGLLELPLDAPVGTDLRKYLDLDDTIFTLKLTPNLGHCLSVYGIARELSALTGAPLAPAPQAIYTSQTLVQESKDKLEVRLEAPDLCGRFSGRVLEGVNTKVATPDWMIRRLERCGQRSVSILVDISNYVMFETGQPNHIFDRNAIDGDLVVRWARDGETLELLNGKTISLDKNVGVIADAQGVESLAGIMGGNKTSVGDPTKNIYLEAAFWHPEAIAGRPRRHGCLTDAGHRFERGVDPSQTQNIVNYLTSLIQSLCGGKAGPLNELAPAVPAAKTLSLRPARARKVLGIDVNDEKIAKTLTQLQLTWTKEGERFVVTPPPHRFDLNLEEDLIEEVMRVYGYNNLQLRPPLAPASIKTYSETKQNPSALKQRMAQLGYHETINFSFVEAAWEKDLAGCKDPIRLLNPIAAPLAVMRTSLIASLVQVLKYNTSRRADRVQVFELGKVFIRDENIKPDLKNVRGIRQPLMLAGLAWGLVVESQWSQKERPIDFFDIKGDVETLFGIRKVNFQKAEHPAMHPGRCAQIEIAGKVCGYIGELHPRWVKVYELPSAPLVFEIEAKAVLETSLPVHGEISRFQSVVRDLAFMVPRSTNAGDFVAALAASDASGRIRDVRIFDVYQPAGEQKSLALRFELLDKAAPLTDEIIQSIVQGILDTAAKRGGHLRS